MIKKEENHKTASKDQSKATANELNTKRTLLWEEKKTEI